MIHRDGETLRVDGALTIDTVPGLVDAVSEHLAQGAIRIDFSGVTDVDSAAVALTIEWLRQAAAKNLPLELTNLPVVLRNLANLYGVSNLLQLEAE